MGFFRLCSALVVTIVLAAASVAHAVDASAKPADGNKATPVPTELQPYQVAIVVGFASDAGFLPDQRGPFLLDVRQATDRMLGQMWQFRVRGDKSLDAGGTAALARFTAGGAKTLFATGFDGAKFEKGYVLVIEGAGAGYRVSGREWDMATNLISKPALRTVYDRRELAHGVMSVVRELFRPLASIETTLTGAIRVHAHAGELFPADADWSPLRVGQFLEPFQRSTDPAVPLIQAIPWTYLKIESVDRSQAKCKVLTALRSPFISRRRRVEVVVLEVRPSREKRRLRLLSQTKPVKPLVGLEVDVAPEANPTSAKPTDTSAKPKDTAAKPTEAAAKQKVADAAPKRPPLVSDRAGSVNLPGDIGVSHAWLSVRSGEAILARIPYVPGIEIPDSIQLPDDSSRINVERALSALQGELVDTVARRAMLFALARRAAKADDWKQVDQQLKLLSELPTKPAFMRKLNATRVTALEKAAAQKAPAVAVARIRKICANSEELVGHYLDDDKLREFHEEIAELRSIAKDDAAGNAAHASSVKAGAKKDESAKPSLEKTQPK